MSGKAARVKFTPGQGLAKAELARAKRFADMFPALAKKMRRNLGGRPRLLRPKRAVSIRLDQDVIGTFKLSGPGWQRRINKVLKQA
jgi:uncharacterized protein (DUF4415 family)